MLFSPSATDDPFADVRLIRRWRCARITMRDGKLVDIRKRYLPGCTSIAGVWYRTRVSRPVGDTCYIDYHQPLGMPAFLTLDFIGSGVGTTMKTFLGACRMLDEVATLRRTLAIVAHVSNASISDRLLTRLGWEQHLKHWSGRHWIKRFYPVAPQGATTLCIESFPAVDPSSTLT